MPFEADTRFQYEIKIELNIRWIVELLEDILEKKYSSFESFHLSLKNKMMRVYCEDIEMAYNDENNKLRLCCQDEEMNYSPENERFIDWFVCNYDKVDSWEDLSIQELFC